MASQSSHSGERLPGIATGAIWSPAWGAALLFTLAMLLVTRLGRQVPIPGLDPAMLATLGNDRIFGFNTDALARTSIFALGLTPFVSAWIVIEIFRGLLNERSIPRYRRRLTFAFAAFQAFGVAHAMQAVRGLVVSPGLEFWLPAMLTILAGTMLLLWLGEQITRRGLCDGIWLIVAVDAIAGLPQTAALAYQLATSPNQSPDLKNIVLLAAPLLIVLVALIVLVESARRIVPLEGGNDKIPATLSMKLDNATLLPASIAGIVIAIPLVVVSFFASSPSSSVDALSNLRGRGQPLYVALSAVLIFIATYLATAATVSLRTMTDGLRHNKQSIIGVQPIETLLYLDNTLTRLTAITACFLIVIFALPEALIAFTPMPFYLGGTQLLVVVIVMLDILERARGVSISGPSQPSSNTTLPSAENTQ
jgi:preprotein translocase subunit SecY